MSKPLAAEIAVVTGAGRGIGRAIAALLARDGAALALCARTAQELGEAARELERTAGVGRVVAIPCDVASQSGVEHFATEVRKALGPPSIVVNNAGIVSRGRLDEQPLDDWRQVVEVNLLGSYLVTRAFLGAMRQARRGRIINIASISGHQGTAQMTAYCAAKHGLVGLTRALAEELRQDGIQVNAVCPGSVDTAMLAGSGFTPDMTPDDVARVVRFLAVEAPPALTGSCLDVFG